MGHPVHHGCSECICIDKSRDYRPRSRSRLTCARKVKKHTRFMAKREAERDLQRECARSLFHPHFRSTQQMMVREEGTSKWIGSKEECTPGRLTKDLFYLGWEKAWKRLEYMPAGITKPRTNISDALQFMRTAQADVHLPMKGVSSPTPPPIRDCLVS